VIEMNQDDIMRMAGVAGIPVGITGGNPSKEQIKRFAALVAAAEREACAKVCDPYTHGQWFTKAIRARGTNRG